MFGLYGLEWRQDGEVRHDPRLDPWVDVVADVATEAAASARTLGAEVEPKGASVTLHWRTAPAAGPWALGSPSRRSAARKASSAQPRRRSVGLRPPISPSTRRKWSRVGGKLAASACFAGDDAGDVAAFAALGRLAAAGVHVQRIMAIEIRGPHLSWPGWRASRPADPAAVAPPGQVAAALP